VALAKAAPGLMRLAGFLLLLAGWAIVLSAAALLKPSAARGVFALAGAGVELMGLVLVIRSHMAPKGDRS
jgi:hypothetical protein